MPIIIPNGSKWDPVLQVGVNLFVSTALMCYVRVTRFHLFAAAENTAGGKS